MRITFFGAAQSQRGLVKMTKSLDFRRQNPDSEPEAVPTLQNPQKRKKVFFAYFVPRKHIYNLFSIIKHTQTYSIYINLALSLLFKNGANFSGAAYSKR